jgi:hypothetical protein
MSSVKVKRDSLDQHQRQAKRKECAMTTRMYRQGEVLFTAISTRPAGLSAVASNVIVQGEVTGHSHRLLGGQVLSDAQGALFLEVLGAAQVIHQEHEAINLPAGCYQVTRQREYTPQKIREVHD